MPTSHADIIPTLLSAAGADQAALAAELAGSFSEVHPLPGRDLMGVVDGSEAVDRDRPVYMMTRDNMLEGDHGASGLARRLKRDDPAPMPLRIRVPAHVASNFEGLVVRVADADAAGGQEHLWKLVRVFDDPATWTEPGVRHLAADGPGGPVYRSEPIDDQWELYDLTANPNESENRWTDPTLDAVRAHALSVMKAERTRAVPERNQPWPYESRHPVVPEAKSPPPPARLLRRLVQKLGMHPEDPNADPSLSLPMRRALIVCTNHAWLDVGQPTGLFAHLKAASVFFATELDGRPKR